MPATGAAHALRRRFVLEHRLEPRRLLFLPENSLCLIGFSERSTLERFLRNWRRREGSSLSFEFMSLINGYILDGVTRHIVPRLLTRLRCRAAT